MNKFTKDLIQSLGKAADHAKGRASSARVHVVEVPDVGAIRRKLHLLQQEFAQKYRIPLPTLRNWEQWGVGRLTRRRRPTSTRSRYARAISEALKL